MSMYLTIIPGLLKVRVGKRGVRTSVGPRWARYHTGGGYRSGVSTGAGPFTWYRGVGRRRRRYGPRR